jgi:Transcriptional activator of glycolytic enzymes
MRRLRIVLLQDLAVLQPRFPSLPFFNYAPFYGPEWNDFARTTQATSIDTANPPSILVQRALPELCSMVESTRNAILHNSQQLISQLSSQLASQTKLLETLLSGKIPITGYLGGNPSLVLGMPGPAPAPAPAPATGPAPAPATATQQPVAPPIVTSLSKLYTVKDVWREWKEGIAGRPSIQELEEQWGSRWRPGGTIRVQFCRRKVIWDAISSRIARGKSEAEAIAEVDRIRDGQSLNRLVDILKDRRQRRNRAK